MKCPGCATTMVLIEVHSIASPGSAGARSDAEHRGVMIASPGSAGARSDAEHRGVMIEIDRCPTCGGIALDKGETEVIDSLGLANVIEGGVKAAHSERTTTARCHECDREMIALRGAGDVEYDWCDGCERLFFDRGELTAIDAYVDG